MKSLKNHLSFIIPLFSIFFAIEFYLILDRVIKNYEENLKEDYTILLVSNRELKKDDLKSFIKIDKLEEIDPKYIIERLKKEDISLDFEALKTFLPKFYKVKLSYFPSSDELIKIKKILKDIDGVKRVETFYKTHLKVYNLLIIVKHILKIFIGMILIISFLLILKQMQVWYLEHKDRMYIMELFGAPLWMRSGVLIRLAIVDTIVSIIGIYIAFVYLLNLNIFKSFIGNIEFNINSLIIIKDLSYLLAFGLFITLFSVLIVSLRRSKE